MKIILVCGGCTGQIGVSDDINPTSFEDDGGVGCVGDSCATCYQDDECSTEEHCGPTGSCLQNCSSSVACPTNLECQSGRCNYSPQQCANIAVNLDPVIPDVMLFVDRSGSMDWLIDGSQAEDCTSDSLSEPCRWNAVRLALTGAGPGEAAGCGAGIQQGVVTDLQGQIRFGIISYNENNSTCPQFRPLKSNAVVTQPDFNRCEAIDDLFTDYSPSSGTPTGEAIDEIRPIMEAWTPPPGKVAGPKVLVVATDGEPYTCDDLSGNNGDGRSEAEDAVDRAFTAGIQTFILSVGQNVADSHLQRMANLGVGKDAATTGVDAAPFYRGTDPGGLTSAFNEIIRGARSCDFTLDKTVNVNVASSGEVVLNDDTLTFGTDWQLVNGTTLRLIGDACDTLRNTNEVTLSAEFPCGSVVL